MYKVALNLILLYATTHAADVSNTTEFLDTLKPLMQRYVELNSGPAQAAWNATTASKIKDKCESSDSLTDESAAGVIVSDWASDNRKALTALKPQAVRSACMWFLYFQARQWIIPTCIRHEFDEVKARRDLVDFLTEETTERKP